MIPLLFLRTSLKRALEKGEFTCPKCNARRTSAHCQIVKGVRFLGFIGTGGGEVLEDFIECSGCGWREPSQNYAFNPETKTFDPVQWDCPWCKHLNPNTTFRCLKCRKSLV